MMRAAAMALPPQWIDRREFAELPEGGRDEFVMGARGNWRYRLFGENWALLSDGILFRPTFDDGQDEVQVLN
jgi:hypothetical protein